MSIEDKIRRGIPEEKAKKVVKEQKRSLNLSRQILVLRENS